MIIYFLYILLAHSKLLTHIQYKQMIYINQIYSHYPQFIPSNYHTNSNSSTSHHQLQINIKSFQQQILPQSLGYPQTKVYGFQGEAINPITKQYLGKISMSPSPTIKIFTGDQIQIKFKNIIQGKHIFYKHIIPQYLVDPQNKKNIKNIIQQVPVTIHLHGGIVSSYYDGYPGSYTTFKGNKGPQYHSLKKTNNNEYTYLYNYFKKQSTMYFHDHTIGINRLNIRAGLHGYFLIQDKNPTFLNRIKQQNDILINIHDNTFYQNGSIQYDYINFGHAMVVNGKVWPKIKIQNNVYRLRILNVCTARAINISFIVQNQYLFFYVVKADSNYLLQIYKTTSLLIMPGQRYQILLDFKKYRNYKIQMINSAPAPYPNGEQGYLIPQTTGKIMRFDVQNLGTQQFIIQFKNQKYISYSEQNIYEIRHIMVSYLNESTIDPTPSYLGGKKMHEYMNAFILGKVYELHLIDVTNDSHTIHIHLVTFEVQKIYHINSIAYQKQWRKINGDPPIKSKVIDLDYYQYLISPKPSPPSPQQKCQRDSIVVHPNTVKIARIKFQTDQKINYPFDVTQGYGYAIHCHMIQHQDNMMMRFFKVQIGKKRHLKKNGR